MQNYELGLFYIDSTYKITIQGFPLELFGGNDMYGQFHPIALIEFSSNEALKAKSEFLKHAICFHLVLYLNLNNLKIFDKNYLKSQNHLRKNEKFRNEIKTNMCY